uniref:Superoxide dismutase copper/zinc binding domain-containing protein n=1 Tax=Chromera velia CCMP2878 TaxID=1169474 RepID=A0A0G4FES4_9ALVE|mmetsp:Transcript_50705/g.99720  ORF Transcript_50705/g.99720 Transcript_50705/m.99720 type:complete len:289 (+) Transcript_50705:175-1041(+)|eukprot:Cvel_3263.t1-p1 / transcript=Cvel_3263.t1 / gene=Cvel_3263 / organism=Chromera_velia_CCMP2878 / gene_product=hypothetical protein / transcript_product=hypothetical protein / location=Cvel_scaffold128:42701-43735(-) / protein_length=288 / sequence_SO=supercontig / SO=protein_coding / is_pseudo=false
MKTALVLALFGTAAASNRKYTKGGKGTKYVAQFDEPEVTGHFNMWLDDDSLSYAFQIEVDQSAFSTCSKLFTTGGLSYHIHSIWENIDDASSLDCGSDNTAGHWDPLYACGPASSQLKLEDDSVNTECVNYVDGDSVMDVSDKYMPMQGDEDSAEAGDLSAVNGKVFSNQVGVFSAYHTNTYPTGLTLKDVNQQYLADLEVPTQPAWASVVFHCGEGGARLFCAKLDLKEKKREKRGGKGGLFGGDFGFGKLGEGLKIEEFGKGFENLGKFSFGTEKDSADKDSDKDE